MGTLTDPIGIDRIGIYPCSLALDMASLCAERGHDPAEIRDAMMVDERSLNPLWEDPVTMAVNAARTMLTDDDREAIELLIVASESGVDQEKPMSTWVHRYLGLTPNCRNFEIKHACYGGTAGLQMAAQWIASGLAGDAKALVIATDQSRMHLGKPWEYVLGAAAAAAIVSANPRLVEFELGKSGYWTHEVSDLTRPTLTVETGNSETSLLAYLEALEGAYAHYCRRAAPDADFDAYFQKHIYHAPFGGMTWRAHRTLLRQWRSLSRDQAWQHFQRKSGAALRYLRRMGGTYSASTLIGLTGLLATSDDLGDGDRVSMFSYGSGSCAEFYSVRVRPGASALAAAAGVDQLLDARHRVTPAEYEQIETRRTARIDDGNYDAIDDGLDGWYDRHYRGKGRLVFTGMRDYYRQYAWS